MKGQVLHLLRVQLKVPGDSSDLSVLLTKKSLMFLLRLNEISGGGSPLPAEHNVFVKSTLIVWLSLESLTERTCVSAENFDFSSV